MQSCKHLDIRTYPELRICLSCGITIPEPQNVNSEAMAGYLDLSLESSNYEYRPLNFELGQEIRLVVLHPGEGEQPVRCEIIHVNLKADPDYAAISYTWADEKGDATKSRSVCCLNGGSIQVTANCEAALLRLRHPVLKLCLWIDAICINQEEISERNHQVGIMGQIYSQASKVYVCIHDPEADHSMAMSWLGGIEDNPAESNELFIALHSLLYLRWFRRVWVIQEVALAKNVIMLVNEASVFLSFDVLQRLRNYCHSYRLEVPGPLRLSLVPGAKGNLFTYLDASRNCMSKDPRDRIYGILSLVEPALRDFIPIDYFKDLRWLNVTVSIAMVRYYRNLDLLSHTTTAGSSSSAKGPFSWVHDWTSLSVHRKTIEQITENPWVPWNCDIDVEVLDEEPERSSTEIPTPEVPPPVIPDETTNSFTFNIEKVGESQNRSLLHQKLGTIRFLIPIPSSSTRTPRLQVRAHFLASIPASKSLISTISCSEFCRDVSSDVSRLQYYGWILEIFCMTPHSDTDVQKMENLVSTRHCSLEKLLQPDQLYSALHQMLNFQDLAKFLKDGMRWGEGRDIFQNFQSVGFTSGNYRVGDEIFAIDGAKCAFILRHIRRNQYKIVSDCYLWASMDSAYWEPGTRERPWAAWKADSLYEEGTRIIELL